MLSKFATMSFRFLAFYDHLFYANDWSNVNFVLYIWQMVIQPYLDSNKDDFDEFNTFHEAISKVFLGSNFGPTKLLKLVWSGFKLWG